MTAKPKQIFNFDLARMRSHLFFRYLATHPELQEIWHPYLAAFLSGSERITQRTVNFGKDGSKIVYQPAFSEATYASVTKDYLQAVKDAEDSGKIPLTNEHSPMLTRQDIALAIIRNQPVDLPASENPTNLPDDIFDSLTPIFVIRNPVFSVPSAYLMLVVPSNARPGGEDWLLTNSTNIQRYLFDHFRKRNGGKPPLIVDGDDIIWRTAAVRDALSQALGLDPNGFSNIWKAVPESEWSSDPLLRYALMDINNSTGIVRHSETPPVADLEAAYQKWCEQYGKDDADIMRATVQKNMPDYEYMKQFKV